MGSGGEGRSGGEGEGNTQLKLKMFKKAIRATMLA